MCAGTPAGPVHEPRRLRWRGPLSRSGGVPGHLRWRRQPGDRRRHGSHPAPVERCGAQRAVRAAGVEVDPLLLSTPHRGQGDPSGDAALHGRARNGDNRGGTGLPHLHGFAATRRDESDRHGGQRDGRRDRAGVAPKAEPEGPPAQTPRDRAWQRWAWRAVLAPLGCGHVRRCEPDP